MRNRIAAFLWTIGVCAACGWLIWTHAGGAMINADLLALLPQAQRDPVIQAATERVNRRFERRLVLMAGAANFETAKQAARKTRERLDETGQFRTLRLEQDTDVIRNMVSFYRPLRFRLLGAAERRQLRAGDVAGFERTILRGYYSPQSAVGSSLIESDPLLLLPGFLEQGAARMAGRSHPRDGLLTVSAADKTYVILLGELADSPFSLSLQRNLMTALAALRADLQAEFPGGSLLMAGVLPHAAAGTDSAVSETSTVGVGSLFGIILLLLAIFRSLWPLALTVASIALGCLSGFAACLAVLGEVHLLTLVFGASLVGISVDYSFHYFCERYRFTDDWSPVLALRHVLPGITLGLITSVIGFSGLFFAPFPGMHGIALFSGVGLVVAYGCVVLCYPCFTHGMARPKLERPLRWMEAYSSLWRRGPDRRAWWALAVVVGLTVIGSLILDARDDIRLLQTPDDRVAAEQARVQQLMGHELASQYFIVEGRDEDDFLGRLESLTERLRALGADRRPAGYLAISDFIASPARQRENIELLTPVIVGRNTVLSRIAEKIGLPEATRTAYVAAFEKAKDTRPVTLDRWLSHPVSQPYRDLWLGRTARGVAGIVGLRGVTDLDALQAIADDDRRVSFIDPAGEISNLFRQYRQQTTWLTLIAYAVVLLLLLIRYGVIGSVLVFIVPVIAAGVSLSVIGLIGETINLFNIMALLLVLGIGIDYALFYRETGTEHPATLLAIALSCGTTLLAFGLLTLSRTAAIHSFGLTILVGIFTAFVLSPMAGWKIGRTKADPSGHAP